MDRKVEIGGEGKKKTQRSCVLRDLHKEHLHRNLSLVPLPAQGLLEARAVGLGLAAVALPSLKV